MDKNILNFIKESNKIEGIHSYSEEEQYEVLMWFIHLDQITIDDILKLAKKLQSTSLGETVNPELRSKKGMNVRVGNYFPPKGGSEIEKELQIIINELNLGVSPHYIHQKYESLHPLTDCNGRTGRVVWAWMMHKRGYDFSIGFLHKWYYQSLDYGR